MSQCCSVLSILRWFNIIIRHKRPRGLDLSYTGSKDHHWLITIIIVILVRDDEGVVLVLVVCVIVVGCGGGIVGIGLCYIAVVVAVWLRGRACGCGCGCGAMDGWLPMRQCCDDGMCAKI